MAKQEDRRKKFWEDKDDDENSAKPGNIESVSTANPSAATASEDVDRKIQEARTLMEQTHQMFQNFFSGVERRMPIEKSKQLEAKIGELQRMGTNLTTAKFKISQFLSQYSTMKELWERKLRERERS